MAAPFILMHLDAQPVSFFELPPPYLPTPEALRARGVAWLAVDRREWRYESDLAGAPPGALEAALQGCCRLVYDTAMIRIYRVGRTNGGSGGGGSGR
jgi:hypothetical protein